MNSIPPPPLLTPGAGLRPPPPLGGGGRGWGGVGGRGRMFIRLCNFPVYTYIYIYILKPIKTY